MSDKKITIECKTSLSLTYSDLVPFQGKLKNLSKENYQKLKKEIVHRGFSFAIHIWTENDNHYVLDGHQRLCTIKQMVEVDGYTCPPIPVVQVLAKNYQEAKLKLLGAASQYGEVNQAGLVEYMDTADISIQDVLDSFRFPELDISFMDQPDQEGLTDPDDVPEVTEPICQLGELWKLGDHRLLCGDCTVKENVDKLMDGEKAETVFTSPPYAVGVDYRSYDDSIENLREMLPKLSRVWMDNTVPGGYAVINFGDIISARYFLKTDEPCEYPMALEYWPVFRNDGWLLWSRRAWCKPCACTGSMQCIGSNRAATDWENVWTWKKPGKAIHDKQTTGDHASQKGWIDSSHSHKLEIGLKDHGAGMPTMLAEFMVSTHSFTRGIVIEPFCGTGTTLIACEKTNRRCFSMEIDPHYCDVIIKRWEDFTGNKANKID